MKKVLFVAVACAAIFGMSSCKKTCTCTEKYTGVTQKIDTDSQYKTCAAIEDLFAETADAYDADQSWSCK